MMSGAADYQLTLFNAISVLLQCCSNIVCNITVKNLPEQINVQKSIVSRQQHIREFMQKLNETSANIHDKKLNSTSVFSWHTCKLASVSFRRLCLSSLWDAPLPYS